LKISLLLVIFGCIERQKCKNSISGSNIAAQTLSLPEKWAVRSVTDQQEKRQRVKVSFGSHRIISSSIHAGELPRRYLLKTSSRNLQRLLGKRGESQL
jgi:hypothetical protein